MRGCRPLTEDEVTKVLSAIEGRHSARDRLLVTLGIRAGFRVSELLSLRIEDVYEHGVIRDHVTVKRRNVKGKKAGRSVILHSQIKQALLEYLLDRKVISADDFLFQNERGNKAISRQQAWNVLEAAFARCELTGVLGTHSMRKTFAARVYEKSGHCLLKTKKALGHTDIRTTEKYLSFADAEVEELIASV